MDHRSSRATRPSRHSAPSPSYPLVALYEVVKNFPFLVCFHSTFVSS
ncbi:hypothetical protein M3J09_002243 [Ascochyta lentis]